MNKVKTISKERSDKSLKLTENNIRKLKKTVNEYIKYLSDYRELLVDNSVSELEKEKLKAIIYKTEYFLYTLKVNLKN